ncbi:hypothetical protein LTR70_010046 [Exophiala xenobiotica]|uniref:Nephrocystin 3-like N-terminal domain-containing protein n=1 Tax=Lithohypha guttulata TaxID=1690604 RepID=A0ABR0JVG6_9EURO|nr:hypothetical protein LTR24_009930 [Lithohypha guttulata]KAK5309734.1 hypothetical protein LTR70_010046 [Exophiala xenobiotica]
MAQGDNHGTLVNNHYHFQRSQKDKCCTLLESLTFDRMNARLRNVATPVPHTCRWLRTSEKFLAWIDEGRIQEHHGFLWIKGKPGSGKSTIMKDTVSWSERAWPTQIILTYFFNARSSDRLEKSSLGLYRSLLHQLLMACPDTQTRFVTRFVSKKRDGKVLEEWAEEELKNFLIELVTTQQHLSVAMFIDALDEGSSDDIRSMVSYFWNFTRYATSAGAVTRVCLSSRHFPYITIQKGLSIVLEKQLQHGHDIETYIQQKFVGDDSPQMSVLRRRVRDRSTGTFLWVVLTVTMLNKLYDQGKKPAAMLQRLNEVPQDLQELFANSLSRDVEDIGERIALFRWMLYSLRPLDPAELYVAVQQACSSEDEDDEEIPTEDWVARYLVNCSRGLVELTSTTPPVVQFIHETVREFLLKVNLLGGNDLNVNTSHTVPPDFEGHDCHIAIAEDCLRYLLGLGLQTSSSAISTRQHILTEYAAEFWWQHAQESNQMCSQTLSTLAVELLTDENNLGTWLQHYDVDASQLHIVPITIPDLASPLYYAARIGLVEVVVILLEQKAEVNAQGGEYGNALQAALANGHEKVVQMLLEQGADVNAQGGKHGNALQAASLGGHERVV